LEKKQHYRAKGFLSIPYKAIAKWTKEANKDKKAVLSQGDPAMPQLFFSV